MTASCPSVRDVSAIGRALASYASTVDSPHGHQNTPGGTPGGAARSGSFPDARGHLHPPCPPLRPRRGADRAACLPLREGARALAYEEEAILVAAATGVTGVVAEEWPFLTEEGARRGQTSSRRSPDAPIRAPLAQHGTEPLLDERRRGLRSPAARRAARLVRREPDVRGAARLYREAIKLQDGRLDIPRRRPTLFRFNEWIVNTEGSTVFIPVLGRHPAVHLGHAPLLRPPARLLPVDRQLGNDPLRPFVKSGLLDDTHPVDLWDFERWQMVDMNGVEEGLMVQNLMLATQALGTGGHPFSGGKGA